MGSTGFVPTPLTRLLGREREAARVCQALSDGARLATLTGPPGVGKTRLALEVAARLAPDFADGAVFVPLAPVESPERVVPAIADTVELHEQGQAPLAEQLRRYLRPLRLLLVLDNFEHVLGVAPAIATLLHSAPGVRLLVTSRVPLRVLGEHEIAVPPFDTPDLDAAPSLDELAANPAVALFAERARGVNAGFALRPDNAGAVARLCRRLDGIPLAIELAAARSRVLGPQALLERIDDRLALLRGGARDLPPRQQTLEAAIAWSYDLLEPDQRRLLCRLAVFAASWDLAAARAVAGGGADVLEEVEALVDHSLVRTDPEAYGEPRFSLLEMIREYAWARLANHGGTSAAELRRDHALHYLGLAESLAPELRGPRQAQALERLDAEHDNLRAALAWALSWGDAGAAQRLVAALWEFWFHRGHLTEGRRWQLRALALSGGAAGSRTRALLGAGVLARVHGDGEAAREQLHAAATLAREAGDGNAAGEALANLSIVANSVGELDDAGRLLDQADELWAGEGGAWGQAFALHARAALLGLRGQADASRALRLRALERSRAIGDPEMIARGLLGLGEVARHDGDYHAARDHYTAALEHFRATGNTHHAALVLRRLAQTEINLGELEDAAAHLREGVRLFRSLHHPAGTAACAATLGCLYHARGEAEAAARCLGAAEAALAAAPGAMHPADHDECERARAALRGMLGAAACEALLAEGRGTAPDVLLAAFEREEPLHPAPGPAAPAVAKGPHESLTGRERGVLALLAQGLSYAQIGRRLFISPRTVDAHLRSIYGKLNVRSRHEAARYAAEHGIG